MEWLPHRSDNVSAVATKIQDNNAEVIKKFKNYLTARADVKFVPEEQGDFQIVSVSDDDASVRNATWLPKNETGYFIQSYTGKLEIFAKSDADGKVQLELKGMDVRDPISKKRIPYWIDYTKLTVNGKVIFDTLTPAWHNKSYNYSLNAKANEEIKIQVEWLPHSGKSSEVQAAQVSKKLDEQNSLISELRVALDNEKKIHNRDVELISRFKNHLTARFDVKLNSLEQGDLQIVSISDSDATLRKATWLPKTETGYFIQSYVGKMEIVAKPTASGQIILDLRGIDVRRPDNKSKRIPFWIDYTKLVVNGEVIFDEVKPAWHNEPYNYALEVKAGDEIKIQAEWLPHRSDV